MDEEVKDSTLIALSALSVVVLLLIACGLVTFLLASDYLGAQPGTQNAEPGTNEGPAGGSDIQQDQVDASEEPDASAADLERWDRITLDSVEDGCLRAAKDEAGENAALVYGCSCEETASSGRKTYGCEIDTADPFTEYFANIDCFLEEASCSIETNYGMVILTFEEMDAWYG
ncbi:MAG: hypothetical protein AB1295_04085 [Candidatus Micrarchaeota archaeon]